MAGPRGQALWLTADGGYAKRPFLRPVLALGLVVFSRLRKDADLRGLPPTRRRPGQRGPPPTYGKDKIDLAKRAGQKRGWRQAAGGVRAVWQAGDQDDQDVRGDLAAGRRPHPRGDRARAGRRQVRNVYASIGALAVNLTRYSLVEA